MTDIAPHPPQRRYAELSPARPLRGLIACYWRFWIEGGAADGPPLTHPIPPDGGVSIAVKLIGDRFLGARVIGPHTEPRTASVGPRDDYRGVRFWPGIGARALGLDAPSSVHADSPLPGVDAGLAEKLAAVPWTEGEEIWRDVLDREMAERLADLEPDRVVARAVATILETRGTATVADLVAGSALSERQLQRRFAREVGMSPKQLLRLRRVRAAAIAALERDEPLGHTAHDTGFADQAHMIREFRRLLGQPPGVYRERIRSIAHGEYER